MQNKDKIIVALDYNNPIEAIDKVEELIDIVKNFKIGLELFMNSGTQIVKALTGLDANIFLDLKFHDIPNTIGNSVKLASEMNIKMLSVHASSGNEGIRAAVANKKDMMILGVTALTSLTSIEFSKIYNNSVQDQILKFADILLKENADGLICSPNEINLIKRNPYFDKLKIVTPGIRPVWYPKNDQKRTMTPKDALNAGADYIVIGRPITQPTKMIGTSRNAINFIIDEIR